MLFLRGKTDLATLIIECLSEGKLSGPEVVEYVRGRRAGVTRQAVYVVLRKLLAQDTIVKRGRSYAINRLWLKNLYAFAESQLVRGQAHDVAHVLGMEDGDKIKYSFKNPALLDAYWGHLFDSIMDVHDARRPVFIYHPHEWFMYAREESERAFLASFAERKVLALFSIGGATKYDKAFKKALQAEYLQISCGDTYGNPPGYHLNIVGDYIFEVRVGKAFAKTIEDLYAHASDEEQLREKLVELSQTAHKSTLLLRRSEKKAIQLSKRMMKYFYIPGGVTLT